MKLLFSGALLAAAFAVTGCASILNDKTQDINVHSSTGGPVEGTVNGVPFKGPGIIKVERHNADLMFAATTEGCVKQTVVPKSVDSVFYINVLSGGAFGSSTDYGTEKMWKYNDDVTISCAK
jgi:hypothetical protein